MKIYKFILIIYLILFSESLLFSNNTNDFNIRSSEIPMLVNGFVYSIINYNKYKQIYQDNMAIEYITLLSNLHKYKIDRKNNKLDIVTELAFCKKIYQFHDNFTNIIFGRNKDEEKDWKCILFISLPLKELNESILLILSSVSSPRTTIFTINNNLDVRLIYHSYKKNTLNLGPNSAPLASIYKIKCINKNEFILYEIFYPRYSSKKRLFKLKIKNNKIQLSKIE